MSDTATITFRSPTASDGARLSEKATDLYGLTATHVSNEQLQVEDLGLCRLWAIQSNTARVWTLYYESLSDFTGIPNCIANFPDSDTGKFTFEVNQETTLFTHKESGTTFAWKKTIERVVSNDRSYTKIALIALTGLLILAGVAHYKGALPFGTKKV